MTTEQPTEDQPMVELTLDECWQLLEQGEVGRLAYHLVDEVHLVPINYAVDDRAIVFRTAPGNKLLAAAMHSEVAFEIDWFGEEAAWSVLVRGRLRRLDESEGHRVSGLALHAWLPMLKYNNVELTPTTVTGRRFLLRRDTTDTAG